MLAEIKRPGGQPGDVPADCERSRCRRRGGVQDVNCIGNLDDMEIIHQSAVRADGLSPYTGTAPAHVTRLKLWHQPL